MSTEFHVYTGGSHMYAADAFRIHGRVIEAIVDDERRVVADCPDEECGWVDCEHGALEESSSCFTGPNLGEAHVFVDGKHVAKGSRIRMTIGGPQALLRVGGRDVGIFEDGRWWRVNRKLERTKPLETIVIGPENALELLEQPWRASLSTTPRSRLSPLAV